MQIMELINKLINDFETYPTITTWEGNNKPDDNLIHKVGLSGQAKAGLAISELVSFDMPEPKVARKHSSKSVGLPVQMFKIFHYNNGGAFVFVRDNFHDIKMCVVSEFPINLDYNLVHTAWTQEEYDAEKKRCIDYDDRGTPRMNKEERKGDFWIKGWNRGTILRKDNRIWKAGCVSSCYCEGINRLNLPSDVFEIYEDNKTMFTLEVYTWSKVAYLMDDIYNSVNHGAYEKLKKQRENNG